MPLSSSAPVGMRRPTARRSIAIAGSMAIFAAGLVIASPASQAETVSTVDTNLFTVSGPDIFTGAVTPSAQVSPVSMVGTPDGGLLWANDYAANAVRRIDTSTQAVTDITGFSGPSSLAIETGASPTYILVTNFSSSSYSRVTIGSNTISTHSLAASSRPVGVAINSNATFAYIIEQGTNLLEEVNLSTNTVSRSLALGLIPTALAISPDGSTVYVSSTPSDTILKITTSTMVVAQTFTDLPDPVSLAIAPDNSRLVFTSASGSHVLSSIVVSTGAIEPLASRGTGRPLAVAIDPASTFAYVGRYGHESTRVALSGDSSTTFEETGIPENAAFFFPRTGGNANAYAFAAQTTTPNLVKVAIAPTSPHPVAGTRGDAQVALTWAIPAYPGAAPITDYVVEYSTDNTTWTTVTRTASTTTSQLVTGLTNGVPYYFRVAGISTAGRGLSASPVGTLTPAAVPGAPTAVQASPSSTQLWVSWVAPVNDGGLAITDYVVEYSTDNAAWTPVSRTPSSTPSQTITGLANGTAYYVRVAAVNAIGTGPFASGGTWTPRASGGGGSEPPADPGSPGSVPASPTPAATGMSPSGSSVSASPSTVRPSIGSARVIYRMKASGTWEVVPRFRAAAKAIPTGALFTAVRSPITGQSTNIPAAMARTKALARNHSGVSHPVTVKGKLWRGKARIIVNW